MSIIEDRGWVTKNGNKFYISDGKGGGGGTPSKPRLDMNGEPFDTPTLYLPASEYNHVKSEISTHYDNYRGKPFAKYKTNKTVYCFENRRFGDYNIYDKYEED